MTEVQSPRAGFCWTQKELTSDLRRMGLAEYLEERPQGSRRLVFPLRGEIVGFDLAANFLDSIVIRVDLMTFQTRDISGTSKKLADVSLGVASDAVCLLRSVSV